MSEYGVWFPPTEQAIRESGIACAKLDPERLAKTREVFGDEAWATELGQMMGRNIPRLFQNHYNGEIARTSFEGTASNLYEILERPDLMPHFFQGFMHCLGVNGNVMPPSPSK